MIRKYYVVQSELHKPCYACSDYPNEESFQSVLQQFNDISSFREMVELTEEQYRILTRDTWTRRRAV